MVWQNNNERQAMATAPPTDRRAHNNVTTNIKLDALHEDITDIKLAINDFLWTNLPGKTTLELAESVALEMLDAFKRAL